MLLRRTCCKFGMVTLIRLCKGAYRQIEEHSQYDDNKLSTLPYSPLTQGAIGTLKLRDKSFTVVDH